MEETIQTLVEQTAGMSAEDIEAMIRSSTNADAFEDPALVAAFLASRAAAA